MESEILKAMKEDMYLSLLIEVIALVTALLTIAWLCFEEIRQPARRRIKPAPELPEHTEYYLLAVLATLDDNLGDSPIGSVSVQLLEKS